MLGAFPCSVLRFVLDNVAESSRICKVDETISFMSLIRYFSPPFDWSNKICLMHVYWKLIQDAVYALEVDARNWAFVEIIPCGPFKTALLSNFGRSVRVLSTVLCGRRFLTRISFPEIAWSLCYDLQLVYRINTIKCCSIRFATINNWGIYKNVV